MKKITASELGNILFTSRSRTSANESAYNESRHLEVGEGLMIDKSEWHGKAAPSTQVFIRCHENKGKVFSIRNTADRSAFVVIRKA